MPDPTTRPFLKWPGGKYRLIKRIQSALGDGRRLIEPFTGSGAVFLNTRYQEYLLADSNPDLISLYRQLTTEGPAFIRYCQTFFRESSNNSEQFYRYREEFNRTSNHRRKSALFLYLNRHCYNGLVRYNKRGEFNTPFGRHIKPYFPAGEMKQFLIAADKAIFLHAGFQECMEHARRGDVVYCDPPYAPLTKTACFTDYHTGGFSWTQQLQLTELSVQLASRGVKIVISNHDIAPIRKIYKQAGAKISRFQVRRTISSDIANRGKAGELIAIIG
ncbi:MAG: Dam family site-specific DNA-(adenine-N6)-methyltransferase [Gammaproteobacteria bacterium]